jgi:hypothetical protein
MLSLVHQLAAGSPLVRSAASATTDGSVVLDPGERVRRFVKRRERRDSHRKGTDDH